MLMPAFSSWVERDGLCYRAGRLTFAGRDVADFAAAFDEPVFLHDGDRALANLDRVGAALAGRGLRHRVYFAMKANRFRPLLCHMRAGGVFGLDVCSAEELREALACGFAPERISFTAHGLTDAAAALLAAFPAIVANLDTISAIRRLGRLAPGREIGLRLNPGVGVAYRDSELLAYSGASVSKFGIYPEHLDAAIACARDHGLTVTALHCHAGCGVLTPQLDAYARVLAAVAAGLDRLPDVRLVNLGGGLGVPHRDDDAALDLARWADLIAATFARRDVEIAVEPGDYAVKDAGFLVLRVNYVEEKRGVRFVGLDGGFNLAIEPAFYGLACVPLPCLPRPGPLRPTTLAGNINEALDIWARDVALPPIEEGDRVALVNTGGYSASMSSNHCMNGRFREFLFTGAAPTNHAPTSQAGRQQ